MIIGFTGAGGTGKSATLTKMSEILILNQDYVLRSVARRVYERRNITEKDQDNMSDQQKYDLQFEIFNERISEEKKYRYGFISDRTLLDHYAYFLFRNYNFIKNEDLISVRNMVISNLNRYDLILYFPTYSFISTEDGFREQSHAYHECIDSIIANTLKFIKAKTVTVPSGDLDERAKYVIKEINRQRGTRLLSDISGAI